MSEEIKQIEFDEIYKNLTNKYLKYVKYLESFFIGVSKTNEPLEALCFRNFYIDIQNSRVFFSDYDISKSTIEIIEYVDFIISLFAKIMNSTFKIDSYYIYFQMFEIINKSCVHKSIETILEFLEKKYPDIKFFKNERDINFGDKLLISKM